MCGEGAPCNAPQARNWPREKGGQGELGGEVEQDPENASQMTQRVSTK
jgi:hypothetical protein